MFQHPANQSILRSKSANSDSSRKGFPNPMDRAACARFRMRCKTSKSSQRPRSPSTESAVSQLQQLSAELLEEVKRLSKAMLLQTQILDKHILSCSASTHDIYSALSETLLLNASQHIQQVQQYPFGTSSPPKADFAENEDDISAVLPGAFPTSSPLPHSETSLDSPSQDSTSSSSQPQGILSWSWLHWPP